jgi:hypothetical protein
VRGSRSEGAMTKIYEPKKCLDNVGESVDNTNLFSKIVKFFKRS